MQNLGVTFASLQAFGPAAAIETAKRAEELGYSSFWTAEVTGPEAFSLLAAAGQAAPSLALGTGVIALQLRTPGIVAMAGATLQALHPDRDIILGVGISSPVVTSRWHGASPKEQEYLAALARLVTVQGSAGGADVARELGRTTQQVSYLRDRLIRKGTIFAEAGSLVFAVPGMADWVLSQRP